VVNVLLIDDEAPFLRELAEGLRLSSKSMRVVTADNAGKALEILNTALMDVVVTDLNMAGMDGYELLALLRERHPNVPVIIMSAYSRASSEKRLKDLRYMEYVEKPVDLDEIAKTILGVVSKPAASAIRTALPDTIDALRGMERKTGRDPRRQHAPGNLQEPREAT
jgi:DNA-binding NtrC family response regulator